MSSDTIWEVYVVIAYFIIVAVAMTHSAVKQKTPGRAVTVFLVGVILLAAPLYALWSADFFFQVR